MVVNHRAEAEKHLANAARHLTEAPGDMRIAEVAAAIGQGYAALAHEEGRPATVADQRDAITLLRRRDYATRELVATHIAKGLISKEPNRWDAALNLATALDEADCNMDKLIDTRLSDDGWDPRSAWKAPASAIAADDPWASKPVAPVDIPESVRAVLAGHLAEMLLDHGGDNGSVRQWARGITHELKREGLDLGDAIKKRITDLTLGADPSDPPF